MLVRRDGLEISCTPLAGSVPRSTDPAEDARRAAALQQSGKDLAEHAFVVEAIVHALKEVCEEIEYPATPELLSTDTVWHLATPISARLADGADGPSALRLAQLLHPTPAVGGVPTAAANAVIADLEGDLRDWFAGCVGWVDASGDGEFAITIRAAVMDGPRLRLFAGAGIVAGSDPASEVRETGAKAGDDGPGDRAAVRPARRRTSGWVDWPGTDGTCKDDAHQGGSIPSPRARHHDRTSLSGPDPQVARFGRRKRPRAIC
ncbi:hypothetical protein G5V59_11040 [Nocardioides sp. W3-2-3]|nr:hypothetical protein [Nocardioides convexus]